LKGLNVLSLFDGISCGRVALERSGINVGRYYASEINETAIKVAKHNFPDIVHLGDVEKVSGEVLNGLNNIDLLIGGSPAKGCLGLNQNARISVTHEADYSTNM
jgi:site-specific DNA-cytosine methylase